MDKTFYRLGSTGKKLLWRIKVSGNVITTWDGDVGGKLTETEDVVSEGKNIGKANETTPEEQALRMAERKIELKTRKGYVPNLNDVQIPTVDDDFFNNPPRHFVGPKPKSSLEPELEATLDKEKRLAYTHKWNGMCVNIVIGTDKKARIFTSNMDDRTEWFPYQVREIEKLVRYGKIKPRTWIVGEVEIKDNPDLIKEVMSANAEEGRNRQKEIGFADFRCFNVVYYDGKSYDGVTWRERHALLEKMLVDGVKITAVQIEATAANKARTILNKNKTWEGLVIWDMDCTDIPIKWGGSPSRDGGAWKLKNFKEADVLIIGWEKGRGKLNDDVATLLYGAYDDSGNIVEMGRGGSGLDEKLRAEIRKAKLPIVAEVKYEEVTENEKFRLPVILRTRIDKKASECLRRDIK